MMWECSEARAAPMWMSTRCCDEGAKERKCAYFLRIVLPTHRTRSEIRPSIKPQRRNPNKNDGTSARTPTVHRPRRPPRPPLALLSRVSGVTR